MQRPNPPIVVGAGSPRMLALAGRMADLVGLHARMDGKPIDKTAVADLTAASIEAKIERLRWTRERLPLPANRSTTGLAPPQPF